MARIITDKVVVTDVVAINELVQQVWRTIDQEYAAWKTALIEYGWKVNQVGIGSDNWRAQWETAAAVAITNKDAGDDDTTDGSSSGDKRD